MKQFEIVTEPIQTEQYRDYTVNEHQGAVVVSQVMLENGQKVCARNI